MNKQTNGNQRWFHPDVPGSVRAHLLGEKHSTRHKFAFGVLIAFFGATMAHYCAGLSNPILAIIGDHIGFGIHGIGYIPMYKALEKGGVV